MVGAYHNNPTLKQQLIARLEECQQAGQLQRHSNVWVNNQGSPVGCLCNLTPTQRLDYPIDDKYLQRAQEWGLPPMLIHLLDTGFQRMQVPARWPIEFLQSIPVNAELAPVLPRLAAWVLDESDLHRVARQHPVVDALLTSIAALHRQRAERYEPSAELLLALRGQAQSIQAAVGTKLTHRAAEAVTLSITAARSALATSPFFLEVFWHSARSAAAEFLRFFEDDPHDESAAWDEAELQFQQQIAAKILEVLQSATVPVA